MVVLIDDDGHSVIELQQQSWSSSVGWFTQTRLPIEREQLPLLRSSLGRGPAKREMASQSETIPFPADRVAARDTSIEIALATAEFPRTSRQPLARILARLTDGIASGGRRVVS